MAHEVMQNWNTGRMYVLCALCTTTVLSQDELRDQRVHKSYKPWHGLSAVYRHLLTYQPSKNSCALFWKGVFVALCVGPFFEYSNFLPPAAGHLLHGIHIEYWCLVTSCHQILTSVLTSVLIPILHASHTILGLLKCFEPSRERDFIRPKDIAHSHSSMQCNMFTPPYISLPSKHCIP